MRKAKTKEVLSNAELRAFRNFTWENRGFLSANDKQILAEILPQEEILETTAAQWYDYINRKKENEEKRNQKI